MNKGKRVEEEEEEKKEDEEEGGERGGGGRERTDKTSNEQLRYKTGYVKTAWKERKLTRLEMSS